MTVLEPGDSFIIDAEPKTVSHYAVVFKRRISTRVCILVDMPNAKKVTKVTIL